MIDGRPSEIRTVGRFASTVNPVYLILYIMEYVKKKPLFGTSFRLVKAAPKVRDLNIYKTYVI
jgi:hypothetical protein